MKLSIFTTITKPDERQDPWIEALTCYAELADEVVVMDGAIEHNDKERARLLLNPEVWGKIKWIDRNWPREWDWINFPLCYMEALKHCTGDWVLCMPIDQIFHESDLLSIRRTLQQSHAPLATFQKYSFVIWNKFFQKGEYPLALNMKDFPNLGYGEAERATDLAFPILIEGYKENGLPYGKTVAENLRCKTGIPFFNYDCTFRYKETERDIFWRTSKARHGYTGDWVWGDTEDKAFKAFIAMMHERNVKCTDTMPLENHPRYFRAKLKELRPDQFGFGGWGLI